MKVSVIFLLPAIEHEGTRSNNMTGKINKIGKKVEQFFSNSMSTYILDKISYLRLFITER